MTRLYAMVLFLGVTAATASAQFPNGYFETAFELLPPYARSDVIAARMLPPEERDPALLGELSGYSIDPRDEQWQVYAPESCARVECGILVWVHPTDAMKMDYLWRQVFDAHDMLYVAALRSGNDRETFSRRIPLALTGLGAMVEKYKVDAARVYVGGFSGGSKVAQKIAFAFPDIFHGAILDAGFIDPDSKLIAPSPTELEPYFERLAFVLVVGRRDKLIWPDYLSLREALVEDSSVMHEILPPRMGHQRLSAEQLEEALAFLAQDAPR